jgi:hypothetical protein
MIDPRTRRELEREHCEAIIGTAEDLARDVGRWLGARGLGDEWPALFAFLAAEHGVGEDDPAAPGGLPPLAAFRFLEQGREPPGGATGAC